jgi:hypothetical protein
MVWWIIRAVESSGESGVTYGLKDGDIVLEVVRLDLSVLFGLSASASRLFEPYTIFFIEYVVAEFGEGGARGCVIGFLVAGLVGGGRSVNLRRKEVIGILVQGSDTSLVVGRHGSGCHGRRRRDRLGAIRSQSRQRKRAQRT